MGCAPLAAVGLLYRRRGELTGFDQVRGDVDQFAVGVLTGLAQRLEGVPGQNPAPFGEDADGGADRAAMREGDFEVFGAVLAELGSGGDRGELGQQLDALTPAECQGLLQSRNIGRIAWNAASSPQILPISYGCAEGLLFFRTSPFGVLSELVRPTQVVLEVDDLDLIGITAERVTGRHFGSRWTT